MSLAGLSILLLIPLLPGLNDELWIDEAYTLIRFASNGFFYSFTDDHVPNNHMPFSALISLLWEPGVSVFSLRLPLLFVHGATLCLLYLWCRRMLGFLPALMCVALYGSSWIISSFALELRGYSLTLLLVVVQLSVAWRLRSDFRRGLFLSFGINGALLVLIMPSNILACGICAVWSGCLVAQRKEIRTAFLHIIKLSLIPLLGLTPYFLLADDLVIHNQHAWSEWPRTQMLAHYSLVLLAAALPASCLVPFGLSHNWRSWRKIGPQHSLLLIAVAAATVFVYLLPGKSYPRTLVMLLPMLYPGIASLICTAVVRFEHSCRLISAPIALPILLLLLTMQGVFGKAGCTSKNFFSAAQSNLCYQRHHDDFHVSEVLDELTAQFPNRQLIIYAGISAGYEVDANLLLQPRPIISLALSQLQSPRVEDAGSVAVLLLIHDKLDQLGRQLPSQTLRLLPIYHSASYSAWLINPPT